MQFTNQQNNNQDAYPQSPLLNRNQKLAVAFLFIFTLAVVGYGAYQFKSNLVSAIDFTGGKPLLIADLDQNASTSETYLRSQDTDKDGLNDWEETNTYGTSPYLEDTDGDGIKDGDEVRNGTDTKCAEGKDCSKTNFLTDSTATGTPAVSKSAGDIYSAEQLKQMEQVTQLIDLQNKLSPSGTSASGTDMLQQIDSFNSTAPTNKESASKILNGQADAQALRQELIKSGMNAADLAKIPDDILMKSYSDILNKK